MTKNKTEIIVTDEVVIPKIKLFNPNRHAVPTTLYREGKFIQVVILPRTSIDVLRSEFTDSVYNLIDSARRELIVK